MSIIRYETGIWTEKNEDGTFKYQRFQIGKNYDPEVDDWDDPDTWSGIGKEKLCYTNKYLLYPFDALEVTRILDKTGVNIQNPGW